MNIIEQFVQFVLHIDSNLNWIISQYGAWTYGILFIIIFLETGLVITPYLPGDSLLFAAGAFAAQNVLNIGLLFFLLALAAILGDSVNYYIGHLLADQISKGQHKIIKREHLEKTQEFYRKYGGKTIVLARFIPIIRTFAPFVAGAGKMSYGKFLFYNIIGAIAWVGLFTLGGYFFGNMAWVHQHFSLVIIAIIVISLIPVAIEAIKQLLTHRASRRAQSGQSLRSSKQQKK